MSKEKAKLNPDLFDKDVERISLRDAYGEALVSLGEENGDVVALSADVKESTRSHLFANKFPERFFQVGIAEQNMALIASGLGISGKIPYVASYAAFSPGRNWEQIRSAVAYNDSNVKIIGHHTGISVGPDGATHQAVEDIAIMRTMANMRVFVPCDAFETEKITKAVSKMWGPAYVRLTRNKTPVITTKNSPFTPGELEIFWESKKPRVAIIACGPLVYNALCAARELEKEDIGSVVANNHTIKPIDRESILRLAKKCGAVVTLEEHQVMGGMGSAVSEVLVQRYPVPQEFVGMHDVFGESGEAGELIEKYGMGVEDIKRAVMRVIKRRK